MFFNRKNFKLLLAGFLSSLAFAPLFLFPIFFFSLRYLLRKIESSKNLKEAFYNGWFFGFGYFIGNCYWYCHSLLMWPYYFLIPLAITVIPAFLACYIALTSLFTKKFLNIKKKFFNTIIFSLFWVVFEYLRGIIFTGFPWNILCYTLGFSPILIQTVEIYGCYIFSFLLITLFTSLYVKNKNLYIILYYIFIILFILIYGTFKLNENQEIHKNFKLVKTNIPVNTEKSNKEIIDYLIDLTLEEDIDKFDYIVWPEAVLPNLIKKDDKSIKYISYKLKNKTLITGGVRLENNSIYNSLLVIKDGEIFDYYDKYKLVPFGEYIPFRNLFPFIKAITTSAYISKGKHKKKVIELDDKIKFTTLICYESIFPDLVNKEANLIINITNDSWFGKTSGPHQHLVSLKFRAIENRIPAMRVSNTGPTKIIDSHGRIINLKN